MSLLNMENEHRNFFTEESEETMSLSESDYILPQPVNCVLTLETKTLCYLPENVFESAELQNVKEVILNSSDIQSLPRSFSSNLQNLEILRIERNKLNELPKHMKYLQFLKYLRASHNNLLKLPDDFTFLVNLEFVDLSHNALSGIPDSIASLVNLRHFNVCNNQISKLSDEIGALRRLEHMNISSNIILNIPCTIGNLKNLTYMNLSSNSISELPDSLHLPNLHTLLLSDNAIKNVPDCIIHSLQSISILDLSHNQIMFFDYPPKCVSKLIKLDISYNVFHDIPQWLFGEKCKVLRELNISDNKHMIGISEPSAYSKSGDIVGVSTSLKILKASNCCFSSSSVEFLHGLKALESLILGNEVISTEESRHIGNILFNFPSKTLNTCTNLRYLNMNNVGLADLPEDIGNILSKLEALDMSYNQLLKLPDSFCKLVTLTKLQVSSNELRTLPSEFGQLATLEELRLDGNKLQVLPDSFKKLKKLHMLDLYDNIFSELPLVIMDLTTLEALDVDFNLFNTDNLSDQFHGVFTEKYKFLKHNMRSIIANKNPNLKREDNRKTDSEENNSEEGDATSCDGCEYEEISSDELIEPESVPVSEEHGKKTDIENWDASDDSDSHFDPHFRILQRPASYGPSLLVYDADDINSEHFCPADLHSEPIVRGRRKYEVEQGQFDDADA